MRKALRCEFASCETGSTQHLSTLRIQSVFLDGADAPCGFELPLLVRIPLRQYGAELSNCVTSCPGPGLLSVRLRVG